MGRVFRPLALSIVVMAALGTVKLAAVFGTVGPSLASAGASAGRTVLPSALAAEHPSPSPRAPEPVPAPASKPLQPGPAGALPPNEPVVGPSEAERALLVDLRARREALDARQQALETRDDLLKAAERGLADRIGQLKALQARLEALEKARRELDESNWKSLVKTYETMRPKDAAVIFNELDEPVLMQVLDRMKEAKAAPVLAAMLPDRARAATAQLVKWRSRSAGGSAG